MKFAYADPPYIDLAHYYLEKREVDHGALIERLTGEFPDGWALSCHTPSLRRLLPLVPEDTRVMAWVKPWCSWKPGVRPAYAWEPILVRGGRQHDRFSPVRDWVAASSASRRGMKGAKPDALAFWLFNVMGAEPDDEFVDLFPGTGTFSQAWNRWVRQRPLPLATAGAAGWRCRR